MTHAEARELLLDLAWGDLDAARGLEVERHAEACAECTRERAQLAADRRTVAPLAEPEEVPAGFDDRILAAARAEASLRADGTPGVVIEATGSVRPAGMEPAMIDPLAPVRTAPRTVRPRRALPWVVGGSVAAAAVLAVAVSSSRSQRDEPATESAAYQIHIKAPQQQPEPAAAAPVAAGAPAAEVAPAAPAAVAPVAPPPTEGAGAGTSAAELHLVRPPAETQRKAARSKELLREAASQEGHVLGGGGDVSNSFQAGKPEGKLAGGAAPPAEEAAGPAQAVPTVIDGTSAKQALPDPSRVRHEDRVAPGSGLGDASTGDHAVASGSERVRRRVKGTGIAAAPANSAPAASGDAAPAKSAPAASAPTQPAPAPAPGRTIAAATASSPDHAAPSASAAPAPSVAAPSDKRDIASPEALEEAARKSRREANYALAAAQYREAARLRRGDSDASAPAWDLAHAIECLSAISQWDEARSVRGELRQRYPGEQSAASAAARALRPAELAPSGNGSSDAPK